MIILKEKRSLICQNTEELAVKQLISSENIQLKLNVIMLAHYIKSFWMWHQYQNKKINDKEKQRIKKWMKQASKKSQILEEWIESADWSLSKILHPATISDACYHQCWISQCVSRQMLVLLRWKVRPLMHYQAINSVTEARSSIRIRFKDQLQSGSCAGSRLFVFPPCGFGHPGTSANAVRLLYIHPLIVPFLKKF